jgi:hypothetical protein
MEQWQWSQNKVGSSISNATAPQKQLPFTVDSVIAFLAGLFQDAPIVRLFGGNATRLGCPLLAISGHTAGSSRTSAFHP